MTPIAIVAHPARARYVSKLAKQVGADAICWDTKGLGATNNHLVAWEWLADSGAPWGVVLEDDVLLAPNFRHQLAEAINHSPGPVLSLYLGRGRPPHWQERIARVIANDVSYYTAPALLSAQGYAMRTNLFAHHYEVWRCAQQQKKPIDESISWWLRRENIAVSYCRYSLVEHIDGPTLIEDHGDGQPRNGKTALVTEDSDPSGAALPEVRKAWMAAKGALVDWTKGSVAL